MKRIIAEMEKNLTEEKKEMLSCIYEPTEVAYPGGYAVDSFAVQRSGEIRYYFKNNCKNRSDDTGVRTYLGTKDCGLTWEEHYEKNPAAMGKCIYVPEMDIFIKLIDAAKLDPEKPTPKFKNGRSGIYALISKTGSDDTNYEVYKVCDDTAHIFRHVIYSASSGLLIATGENVTDEIYYSIVFTSADGGKTWSDPMPTDFHATLTMPTIRRMTDGDIIFTWCNTQPLPEIEHKSAVPPVDETVLRGRWKDCFTNRDTNHIVVSSDNGKTWQGFREMALSLTDRWFNPIDTYVREAAQISVNIDGSCIPYNKWCTVRVLWDCDEKTFSVYADDDKVCGGEIIGSCPNGLCYAHFQSLAEDVDSLGTYIRFMEKK